MRLAAWLGVGLLMATGVAIVGWWVLIRGVETPAHEVVLADGTFELRAYPAMTLVETDRTGGRDAALRDGFSPLARYIFAWERAGPTIAMTAPVVQTPGEQGWTVAFILPAAYADAAPPKPASPEVRVAREPAGRWAAVHFSGRADDADFTAKEQALRGWMAAEGLRAEGPAVLAYYDDPLTPGFLRRNEVLIRAASAAPPG
jgi:hypothetical protein